MNHEEDTAGHPDMVDSMIEPVMDSDQATELFSARSLLLERLFDFFHRGEIPYCVLGDSRGVPQRVDSDVDFVVDQKVLHRLPEKLSRFCLAQDVQLVQSIRHEHTAYFLVLAQRDEAGRQHFLQADICGDYYRNGKRFLRAQELLTGRTLSLDASGNEKSFYAAAPAREFIYYLLKKVDKQDLNEKQGEHLSQQWHQDPAGAAAQIRRFWSETEARLLAEAAEKNSWDQVRKVMPALQRALHRRLRFSLKAQWHEFARKMRRLLHPTGFFVAVLGPDGSGKSSVIERVLADLAPACWSTSYMHLRPGLGTRAHEEARTPVVDPQGQAPRSMPTSILKIVYYFLDYTVGYLWKVRPRLARSTLVLFDRYYHDLLVDPKRYRYGGPPWLARLIGRLIPHPDLFIFLDAPPEVIQARKQEVPFEETARQRAAYRNQAHALPNSCMVDVAQPLDEVVAQVEQAVLDYMAGRMAKRLGIQVASA